jgi:hypothetical protein
VAKKKTPKPKVIPPPGWYDPALEAQRRAAQRGYGDLQRDTELAGARAGQDYTFGREGLERNRDRGYEDVARQVALLTRNYQELGRTQAEGDARAGVINPAIAAKQMQIRAQNMAFDRQPLDMAQTRIGQDYSTGLGQLDVGYARGGTDRATGLARAGRENVQFGLDIGDQERYQAIQAGWAPPPDPRKKKVKMQTWRPMTQRPIVGGLAARPGILSPSWGG